MIKRYKITHHRLISQHFLSRTLLFMIFNLTLHNQQMMCLPYRQFIACKVRMV